MKDPSKRRRSPLMLSGTGFKVNLIATSGMPDFRNGSMPINTNNGILIDEYKTRRSSANAGYRPNNNAGFPSSTTYLKTSASSVPDGAALIASTNTSGNGSRSSREADPESLLKENKTDVTVSTHDGVNEQNASEMPFIKKGV